MEKEGGEAGRYESRRRAVEGKGVDVPPFCWDEIGEKMEWGSLTPLLNAPEQTFLDCNAATFPSSTADTLTGKHLPSNREFPYQPL